MADERPLQQAWARLAKADEIVQGLADRGWITDAAMAEVAHRSEQVARRVGRDEHGGGRDDDPALVHEVGELTALLVALADEAISRQPSLAPDTPVPVALDDARRRLSSTHAAYEELD